MNGDTSKAKIAVLSVHGVADQEPSQTARDTAGLLLGECLGGQYSSFIKEDIHIGQCDVVLEKNIALDEYSLWSVPNQSSNINQRLQDNQSIAYSAKDEPNQSFEKMNDEEFEHESMREQIQGYQAASTENVLDTVVLKGKRNVMSDHDTAADVDIYECYWADLSRLKTGYFTIFFEFYLFLFFFSRIGGTAVERAAVHFRDKSHNAWRNLQRCHLIGELSLVIGVPITHLALLSLAASGIPLALNTIYGTNTGGIENIRLLFLTLVGVSMAAISLGAGFYYGKRIVAQRWPIIFLLCLVTIVITVKLADNLSYDIRALVFLIWLLITVVLLYMLKIYNKRRPGAFPAAIFFLTITGIVFLYHLLQADGEDAVQVFDQGIEAFKILIYMNVAVWVCFVNFALISSVLGFFAVYKTERARDKQRAYQTIWTQALSLVLPGLLIMLITFALWQAIIQVTQGFIGNDAFLKLQYLIDSNIFPHLSLGLIFIGLGIAFVLWMISPAPMGDGSESQQTATQSDNSSEWTGKVLSNAYNKMRWVGEMLRFILLIAIQIEWFYLLYMQANGITDPDIELHREIILYGGFGILLLLFGSKGPFSFLAMGFRAGLDVALDVANWLRFRPREDNPRGAICRRYVSILRHIADWRDPMTGKGYDGVVIVSHSQGTVITADLLRYLSKENQDLQVRQADTSIARYFDRENHLPIHLMTFGSPLRQLYNLRFPFQYRWAGAYTQDRASQDIKHGPDPKKLGVASWSNLYCSGDYVGRYLWHDESDDCLWSTDWQEPMPDSKRYANTREKCLGAGGHTKYWSGRFTDVSLELDRLILVSINQKNKE